MPNDTLWLNNMGDFIILDSGKDISEENINLILSADVDSEKVQFYQNEKNTDFENTQISKINLAEKKLRETAFDKEVAYYNEISVYIEFGIVLMAVYVVIYAYRRAKKYKENPFDEDPSDWVELAGGDDLNVENIWPRRNVQKKINEPLVYTYDGRNIKFTDEQLKEVLEKRFSFYIQLNAAERNRFLQRLKKFIRNKFFKIHTANGFKEMPILLCATAIQLSFGIEEYLLPHYKNIHIFPEEFLGLEPNIRFLVGNVSKNNINISWKHFLEGYNENYDGHNVGLHEMAHAYYCQNIHYQSSENNFT